jgi:hypothetical protein
MAAQVDVLGLVHNAHASAAQLREDTVVRYGLADHSVNTPGRESLMLGPRLLASQTCGLSLLYEAVRRQVLRFAEAEVGIVFSVA